ncbi:family 10 glycosylhydrolase [Carboxylicivirga sp. A043]|uniref:glycoside hydrolase family 10 protein n=1 Tax=Carboxylicivirga litoralis TaxID=2816963 RepID=UPI0021CB6CCA|nr:family 10 glycosylhydrolase [Carboxylicivirga sp. A043]MCU4154644.1 family 10 glycosylhydrolase [Carboxylicivirga sp. A043]
MRNNNYCRPFLMYTLLLFLVVWPVFVNAQIASPKYEMRGVWVATVANIDWPSKPGLKVKQQKKEALEIIKHCKELGMNTIFLQVRPASDVLYISELEPWSKVLSGEAGKKPKYDPLQYWIEQSHLYGLELHAWINPYRASMNLKDELPEKHPFHRQPELFVEYGNKLYYNPGHPKSNEHINKVVRELVQNYNIDGVHMDDYFYPYPIKDETFPDSAEYLKYGLAEFEDINAWRRHNVDRTIESLHTTIKSIKPWMQFGVSPFGVWRNKSDDPRGSESRAGTTNYDGLHADILLWMQNKWVDYVVPQLYWGTSHPVANYNYLSEWWNENHYDVPVYIGHGVYKIGNDQPDWQDKSQLPYQMKSVRDYPNLNGNVFFSYKHFKRDLFGFQDSLKSEFYRNRALVPHGDREKHRESIAEIGQLKSNSKRIKWKVNSTDYSNRFVIYLYHPSQAFAPENPQFIFDTCYKNKYRLPKKKTKLKKEYLVRVATLNRYGAEGVFSQPVLIKY